MSFWWNQLALLADMDRLRSMGNQFRGRRARIEAADVWTGIAILAAFILAVWVLTWFVARRERKAAYNSPRKLFNLLCKQHEVGRAGRRLLKQLARWHGLASPAQLFLNPDYFDPASLSPYLRAHAADFEALKERLFGTLLESEAARAAARETTGPNDDAPPNAAKPGAAVPPVVVQLPVGNASLPTRSPG